MGLNVIDQVQSYQLVGTKKLKYTIGALMYTSLP